MHAKLIARLKLDQVKVTLGSDRPAWSATVRRYIGAPGFPEEYEQWAEGDGHEPGWLSMRTEEMGRYTEEVDDEALKRPLFEKLDAFMTSRGFQRAVSDRVLEYRPERPDELPMDC